MVAGDLVNTASRLQSVAPPGAVLVGEVTLRASEAAIDYEPAGEQVLKGRTAPVPAWRALRVAAGRLGSGRVTRLEPPFVGRDDELRLLKEVFHQTARERRPRLVSITGIAGIGKSRLAWELEKYIDGLVETVYWHQGRSPAYGDGLAFWALGEMVRRRARIAETDDPTTARARLAAMAAEYLPDPDERGRVEPRLAALLGLEPSPPGGAEELTAAWRTLFERIADLGPTVLVFEDLHWADDALLDFIESLLGAGRSRPIFVVALARPELIARRPTWGAGVRNHMRLDLAPLDDEAMELLLVGLAPGIPASAIRAIRTRAEGVPLYAVETVRMLVDQGRLSETDGRFRLVGDLTSLAVPQSLQALLGSRLDALDPDARDLVGHCAVLGVSFTVEAAAALAGRSPEAIRGELDALVDRELLALDDDPRSPERGQYHFLQGVLREVAYGRLSRRERMTRHLAAAEAFQETGAEELAGVVATHYLEAFRAASADDQVAIRARALRALEAAASRARAIGAHAGAARYLRDGLDLAADDDERLRLREARLGDLYWTTAMAETIDEGRALVEAGRARGDPGLQARAGYYLVGPIISSGSPADAVREAEAIRQGLGAFATTEPDGLRLTAELARCHLMNGEPGPAAELIEATLPVVERLGLRETIAELLASKGWTLGAQGRQIEAMALLRGALTFAERNDLPRAETRARMNFSSWAGWEDTREAFEVTSVGITRDQQRGYEAWAAALAGNACTFALQLGEWDWVVGLIDRFGFAERDAPWEQAPANGLAVVEAFRGRHEEAEAILRRFSETVGSADDPQLRAGLHYLGAEIAFAAGDLDTAAVQAEQESIDDATTGSQEDPHVGLIALERRDPARILRSASAPRGGRLGDAFVHALAGGAGVLDGDPRGLAAMDASADVLEGAGVRFLGAQLRRARAMLAPDDPGAARAAEAALAVFRDLGAVAMYRGLERWLPEAVPTSAPPAEPARAVEG
jgi:predicted ATPase